MPGAKLQKDRLDLGSFSGLFIISGVACFLAMFIYFAQILWQFRYKNAHQLAADSRSGCLRTFLSFVDKKQERKSKKMSPDELSSKNHAIEVPGRECSSSYGITAVTSNTRI